MKEGSKEFQKDEMKVKMMVFVMVRRMEFHLDVEMGVWKVERKENMKV